jgi:hypothetical protein
MKIAIVVIGILSLAVPAVASDLGNQAPPKPPSVVTPNVPDPTRQGGDTIATAFPIPALPYFDTGTTTGYTDDYDEVCPYDGAGADVVYEYTAPIDQLIDIDLCGSNYDSKVFVYDEDFHLIACNDDYYFGDPCGIYTSRIDGASLTAGGRYDIIVDGYGADHGDYVLAVTVRELCEIACPATGVPEGEPPLQADYVDSFNGGCDYSGFTPTFRVITGWANGEFVLCGKSGWFVHLYMYHPDTDWFILFTGQTGTIEATIDAELESYAAELSARNCQADFAQTVTSSCEPVTMTITGHAAGEMVWFRVAPTSPEPPSWIHDEYDYVVWFTGLLAPVATESSTWSTVKALYE